MARKSGGRESGEAPESPRSDGPAVSRRTIKREADSSQLLERGEGPTAEEQIDESVDSPSEITTEGGPGGDSSDAYGGSRSNPGELPNQRSGGTGGEGGYSTLGGGVYPDEGDPDDAPSYGDWQRHSSGASSGARGQEGMAFPGEHTWGEEQFETELREEQGRPMNERTPRAQRRPDETLARELQEILTKDPELDSTEIEVQVEGGAVTLIGTVDSSDAKLLAEELVESVTGVREVHNRLRVER
jgi:osmotically-inducible protein OsmY